jgi:chemotaxis signal transduction protein
MLNQAHSSFDQALLVVHLGDQRYGLPLDAVERVLPMAYVQAIPGQEQGLVGALNLRGDVLPVVDPRPKLGLATPAMQSEQRLVLISAASRFLLWVDLVDDVVIDANASAAPVSGTIVSRLVRLDEAIVPVLSLAALAPRMAA